MKNKINDKKTLFCFKKINNKLKNNKDPNINMIFV